MDTDIINWVVLVLCLLLAFLLSGMEAGVFALSRLRVRRLARAGKPSAKLLHGFLEKPENFLWTILVGNTLANFLILGWTLLKLHDGASGPWRLDCRRLCRRRFSVLRAVRFAAENVFPRASEPVVPVGGARVPPRAHRVEPARCDCGRRFQTALRLTGGQAFTGRLFGSREEMRSVMQESAQALTSDERAMINRVLDLQNFTVRADRHAARAGGGGRRRRRRWATRSGWRANANCGVCRSGRRATAARASPGCLRSARCCSATIWICRNPPPRT